MLRDCRELILDTMCLSSVAILSSGFSHVTHLYLQRNGISDLSPLVHLTALRFAVLSSNVVEEVVDLTPLRSLVFLDLSLNAIDDFDPELLPFFTCDLRMNDNPCTAHPAYTHHVLAALPYLTVSPSHTLEL